MSVEFEVNAQPRSAQGTGASRRLRKQGLVPAILYGGAPEPRRIQIEHDELFHHLENEAFYSHILTLKLEGAEEQVILRNLQLHPYKREVMHADFQRVDQQQLLKMVVSIHVVGEEASPAIRSGGQVSHLLNEIEISCKAQDLPEYLEIDIAELELDHPLHLSDIKLPQGVSIPSLMLDGEHDLAVAVIHLPKVAPEEPEIEEAEAGEEEESPPESEE